MGSVLAAYIRAVIVETIATGFSIGREVPPAPVGTYYRTVFVDTVKHDVADASSGTFQAYTGRRGRPLYPGQRTTLDPFVIVGPMRAVNGPEGVVRAYPVMSRSSFRRHGGRVEELPPRAAYRNWLIPQIITPDDPDAVPGFWG